MIVITVQSFNGQPIAGISASFDELGGTIGRADNNQLVLADPDRSISRVHAQVVFRNGNWGLVDRGSNPVQVNGQPVGNGREAAIRDGDSLVIGGYQLAVSQGQKTVAPDPFGDMFGSSPSGTAPAPPARPVGGFAAADPFGLPPRSPSPPPPASPFGGPSGYRDPAPSPFGQPSGGAADPFGAMPAGGPKPLADDWDLFPANPAPAPGAAAPAGPNGPRVAVPSREDSLDAFFDLGGGSTKADPFGDPFAGTPMAAPLAQANTHASLDPLAALGLPPAPVAPTASDLGSDLNTPMPMSALRPSAPPPVVAASPASPSALPGAVFSWNQPSREAKVVTLPGTRAGSFDPGASDADNEPGPLTRIFPRSAPTGGATAMRAPAPAGPAPVLSAAAAPASYPAASVPPSDTEGLRRALAEGLGLPPERLRPIDAAQMHLIGELLRESVRGAVDLLVARAALKHEIRTEVTMMGAQQSNPLKFSPSVEVAIDRLLGEPLRGFMPPGMAVRDAFDDLRAHQLGVVAGMRAALDGVLLRFEPAQLEGKIAAKRSALSALLPSTRKAQLWEAFQQLYAQLSEEAADDFQKLFGEAFRKAYEAHIDELQSSGG